METNDRLTVITIGVGIVLAITAGACSTNARIADLRANVNARFAEANEQRREEHRRIDERLDRIEEILLKPAPPNAE